MSHIFDALQRSEAEQSGTGRPSESELTVATELLQLAERKRRGSFASSASPAPASPASASPAPSAPAFAASAGADAIATQLYSGLEADLDVAATPNLLDSFPSLPICLMPDSKLVAVGKEESLGAEKFRFLAVRLRQLRQSRAIKKILITSSIPQEGKSTVSANLACTLARRKQHKTLLIEGDLRRPTIGQKFGFGPVPGLSEWLRGETESRNIYRLDQLGLWVLPAGSAPENALELMQSGKLPGLMEQLTQWFDWVIIDSPPVLPLADTSIWARLADGILLVTRKDVTEKKQLQRGLEALDRSKLLGAVVNGSTDTAHSDYYQRYGPAASASKAPAREGK
jgi:capsular exopolysaccharide synthesis family protein